MKTFSCLVAHQSRRASQHVTVQADDAAHAAFLAVDDRFPEIGARRPLVRYGGTPTYPNRWYVDGVMVSVSESTKS